MIHHLHPSTLVVSALIFITLFFWIQTFAYYWNILVEKPTLDYQNRLKREVTFNIFLTLITILLILLIHPIAGEDDKIEPHPPEIDPMM